MATRINTKFVLILGITVSTAVGIVGGLWVLQIRGDTSRHIRNGDAMMAEARALDAAGDDAAASVIFEKAVNEYGRAVNKEPADLGHLQKVEDALLSLRPMTQDQANEFDGMRIGVLRRDVRYQPRNADAHLALIRELHRIARWFDQVDHWQEIADSGDDMFESLSPGDPKRIYGRFYRGMAQMQFYGYGGATVAVRTATQDEVDAALDDLKAFVQAVPDDDLGQATLIDAQLSLARQLRSEGSSRAADLVFADVESSIAAALEAVPNGPEVARIVALRLMLERMAGKRPANDPELIAAVDRMVDLLASSDNPMLLVDAGRLVRVADRAAGTDRAIGLLEDYVKANDEAYYQRYQLAKMYYENGDLAEAREQCEIVINARPVRVSVLARIQQHLRTQCAGMIVDCEYRLWELWGDPDEPDQPDRSTQLAKVEAARDALAAMVVDPDKDPLLLKADGKIAAARFDHATAAARFERVLDLVPVREFEVLWYAARSLEQIDQIGLARLRLIEAAAMHPQNVAVLADKARLEFRMGLYDEAEASGKEVLALDPDNVAVLRYMTAMEATRGGAEGEGTTPMARSLLAAAAAIQGDDIDGAREILLRALENTSDRMPALTELVHVELRAGRTEVAQEYLAQALALQPGNSYLRKLEVSLKNEDQIEALKQYMADLYPNETDRVVNTFIYLAALVDELDRRAARYDAAGNTEAADHARARLAVAREESGVMRARAGQIAPGHAALLEHLFNEALAAKDWTTLESIVATARSADSDLAGGLIFKGRYELARQNYAPAIVTLTEATERKHYSATAWRFLGRAHERTGNFAEALRAYEQSYTCNPNDRVSVRWYVNLLLQTGGRDRALRVLRTAQHTIFNDALLHEARLELEAAIGDVADAMRERRRQYESTPRDRSNAMRLAALLAETSPTYAHVVDDNGSPRYKPDDWQLLAEGQRRQLLQETADEWIRESDEILAALVAQGEDSVEIAALRAGLLRTRGLIDEGEEVLRTYRDLHVDDVRSHMALAAYQRQLERVDAAIATLESARPYQAAEVREADLSLADLYFEQARWKQAGELYVDVAAVKDDSTIRLRLVECFTKLDRYDEADVLLTEVVASGGQDFFTAMLRASIAEGQAAALAEAGLTDRAELKDAEVVAALNEAERRLPSSPLPHVRRAQRLLQQYQRTERQTLLDDALRALDRADRARADAESTSRVRVEIFWAQGDIRGAIGELRRIVQRKPDDIAARRQLVQLLVESGDYGSALQVVAAAIERNPSIGLWHDASGELYVQRSNMASGESAARAEAALAASAFREAFRLQPTAARLAKYAELALSVNNPDYGAVTSTIEESRELLQGSPMLRGLYAAALTGAGRDTEAVQQMRLAWGEHTEILEMQPEDRRGIVNWYRMLQMVLTDRDPAEYEQLVRELAGGEPTPLALAWTARTWAAGRDRDGVMHAIELLDTAASRCPADDKEMLGLIGLDRGQYYLSMNQFRQAADAFEDVIELAAADPNVPDHALALNNAAYLYAEHLGDPERAAAYAQRADEVKPGDPSILDTLGWALCKLNRNEEAEDALRLSIKAGPSADNHLHIAWVFYQTGDVDNARLYLRTAAELRPSPGTQVQIDELAPKLRR